MDRKTLLKMFKKLKRKEKPKKEKKEKEKLKKEEKLKPKKEKEEKFDKKEYMTNYRNNYMRQYYYDDLERSKIKNKYYYYHYRYGFTKQEIGNKTKEELKELIILNRF